MDIDFKALKKIVDDTIMTEGKCIEMLCTLLAAENQVLKKPMLKKIICLLSKWSVTPPVEILKELEELVNQKTQLDCVASYAIMSLHGAIAYDGKNIAAGDWLH